VTEPPPEPREQEETAALRAIARRRLGRIAFGYGAATAVLLAVNVATHGPSWWYFAAGGVGFAIVMQALRLRS
jgi:hypothetical protein